MDILDNNLLLFIDQVLKIMSQFFTQSGRMSLRDAVGIKKTAASIAF